MRGLQRVFDFYLDASVHVAFAVFALVKVTDSTLNISTDLHLSWFLFFGTIVCYNFVKYGVEAEKYVIVTNRYHRIIQSASFIAFGLAAYHAYFLPLSVWVGVVTLLVLTGLYALPLLPYARKLRSLAGLKVFVVAIVWAGATVVLPVLAKDSPSFWNLIIETLQRFIFVLILMLPFEIRDLVYDSPELRTLPQRYGVQRTKVLGALATLFFFLLTFLKESVGIVEAIGAVFVFAILGGMLFFTKNGQSKYFASFWIEAIPIFWWVILIGLQNLL